jgi:hypothetical protein
VVEWTLGEFAPLLFLLELYQFLLVHSEGVLEHLVDNLVLAYFIQIISHQVAPVFLVHLQLEKTGFQRCLLESAGHIAPWVLSLQILFGLSRYYPIFNTHSLQTFGTGIIYGVVFVFGLRI